MLNVFAVERKEKVKSQTLLVFRQQYQMTNVVFQIQKHKHYFANDQFWINR